MRLWIVGQYRSGEAGNAVWDFQGVFDTEEKAVAACRTWDYFVMPARLNESLQHESIIPEDAYYPHARAAGAPGEQPKPTGDS